MPKKIFIILTLTLLLLGCSSYRPHTKTEKYWLAAMISAQAADVATTEYALHRGLHEANPILGKDPSLGKTIGIKALSVGVIYLMGQIDPKRRKLYYQIGTVVGLAPAIWNWYQIERNGD